MPVPPALLHRLNIIQALRKAGRPVPADLLTLDGAPEIGRQLIEERRWLERTRPIPSPTPFGPGRWIGGPLPDPAWDRFFGGMQVSQILSQGAGKDFGVDWSGFGALKAQDLGTGRTYALDRGEVPPGFLPAAQRELYYADRPEEALTGARARRRAMPITGLPPHVPSTGPFAGIPQTEDVSRWRLDPRVRSIVQGLLRAASSR